MAAVAWACLLRRFTIRPDRPTAVRIAVRVPEVADVLVFSGRWDAKATKCEEAPGRTGGECRASGMFRTWYTTNSMITAMAVAAPP